MNTVKKGNVLEQKSLLIIEKLVKEGIFGLEKNVRIFKKEKYPSKTRGVGSVEFDLSIEIWPPGAERYFLVYFIECKNYGKRLPIDQVKKFYADILEVSGANAKGIIISATPLQKGAYDYAFAKGLMVLEGVSQDGYKIIQYKKKFPTNFQIPIIKETLNDKVYDVGVKSIEKIIDAEILKAFVSSTSDISFGIDRLSKSEIAFEAKKELDSFDINCGIKAFGVDRKALEKHLKEVHHITITMFHSDEYLGTCDIDQMTIGLSANIIGTPRELFVLCHELGHFILHQNLAIKQELLNSFSDSERNYTNRKTSLENPKQWIEWQANYFSISFLLPKSSLIGRLAITQKRMGLKPGSLIINDQNYSDYRSIIEALAYHFGVSKTSVIFRLREFDLIENNSRLKSVGELIDLYDGDLFV